MNEVDKNLSTQVETDVGDAAPNLTWVSQHSELQFYLAALLMPSSCTFWVRRRM